jgi:hypothetical protein
MRSSNWMGVAHPFPQMHWTPTIPPHNLCKGLEEFVQFWAFGWGFWTWLPSVWWCVPTLGLWVP